MPDLKCGEKKGGEIAQAGGETLSVGEVAAKCGGKCGMSSDW